VITGLITEEEFFNIAEESGWPLKQPPVVCCLVAFKPTESQLKWLQTDCEEWQAWIDTAIDMLLARLGVVTYQVDQGIVILQNPSNKASDRSVNDIRVWAAKVSHVIKDVFRTIDYMVGVSTADTEIRTVYKQAYEAVKVGPIFHPEKSIHFWDDLGVCRLLIDQAKSKAGIAFIRDYLGPLLESSPRNTEWLMTLQEFVSGDTMTEMAARLHIHPKTLVFRRRKIEKLLQTDLDDPEQRLNIAIALKLKQLREKL